MRFEIDMANPQILNMPVKAGLKLMTVVGRDGMNAEKEPLDHMVDEIDSGLLIVRGIDL